MESQHHYQTMEDIRKQLSTEDCQEILGKCLKGEDLKVLQHKILSLSDKIEGFLGEHFIVILEYKRKGIPKTHRCFMKVLNGKSTIIFEISKSINAYEKEKFFYEFLLKEYAKCNIDISFTPQGYLCKPYLFVLEDMTSSGYRNVPKNSFLDLEHCKVVLKTLAKFHSTSILYEETKSEELGAPYSLVEVYPDKFKEMIFTKEADNFAKKWFTYSLGGIYKIIDQLPRQGSKREKFKEKLRQFVVTIDDLCETFSNYKCTVLHGDLWSNNFLFKYEGTSPVDSVLIDYQLIKFGPPSMDVIHLLFSNTRKKFRNEHFSELIEFYYECLSQFLSKLDVNTILPKEQYFKLCSTLQTAVKLQCICDRCVTFMPDELVHETVASDEDLRRYLFDDRAKIIESCYKNYPAFQKLLEEDLLELQEMLLKK